MIRLWRDSTAPRRLAGNRGEQRRLDDGLLEAQAELIRSAWSALSRHRPGV